MKDINTIKEFFSKPLEEAKEKYYVAYNGKGFYGITTKSSDKIEGEYSKEEAEKIAAEKNKSLKEIDINDPVLMKARAAAFQRTQPKPEPVKTTNSDYKAIKNADKIKALKIRRAQLMRDMEQEAEPEGGPIADRYGSELNKIDKAIAMLSEAKTAVDKIKKQLDALGVKYEMSATDKVRPFKVIYKPVNKSDEFYDKFEDIVDLFNLKSFVKSSMNEAKEEIKVGDIIGNTVQGFNFKVKEIKNNTYIVQNTKTGKTIETTKDNMYKSGTKMYEAKEKNKQYYKNVALLDKKGLAKKQFSDEDIEVAKKMLSRGEFKLDEAKKEDPVDTITMDIPLFIRMLEYSREDASQDMDLHDVTEKANKLGKEKGILSMEDYEEIVGAAEEIKEVNLKQSKLSSSEYQKAKKLKDFKASDWKWNADEDLYTKVNEDELTEAKSFTIDSYSASDSDKITDFLTQNNISFKKVGPKIKISLDRDTPKASVILSKLNKLAKFDELNEAELTEAYVPSNIKEFAKRKGVSALVNKVAGWAERVGKRITGGTAIGYNYSTLVLDMEYQGSEIRINTDNDTVTLYDEPVNSFAQFKRVYDENNGTSGNNLEERIAEALNKINEELCPAGKAYIKRRKAAGEKSSAYLSGRAVKVCKGQMSGKSKKK